MNNIFDLDPECQRRQLSLATFEIIPMTRTLGLLEWVDKTKVLKEILERELQEKLGKDANLSRDNPALNERLKWLEKFKGQALAMKHIPLLSLDRETVVTNF